MTQSSRLFGRTQKHPEIQSALLIIFSLIYAGWSSCIYLRGGFGVVFHAQGVQLCFILLLPDSPWGLMLHFGQTPLTSGPQQYLNVFTETSAVLTRLPRCKATSWGRSVISVWGIQRLLMTLKSPQHKWVMISFRPSTCSVPGVLDVLAVSAGAPSAQTNGVDLLPVTAESSASSVP